MELLRPSPQQLKYDLEFSLSPFLPSPGLGQDAEEFHRKIIKCRGAKSQNYLQKVNIFTTMHPHPTSSCLTDDVTWVKNISEDASICYCPVNITLLLQLAILLL